MTTSKQNLSTLFGESGMYSKSNDNVPSSSPPKTQIWSMKGKLTLFVTISVFGLFIISSLILYQDLVVNVEREENGFIDDDIIDLQNIVAVYHKAPRLLQEEIELEGDHK